MKKYYVTIQYNNGVTTRGYILDISKSGIALACAKRIPAHTVIVVYPAKDIFLPLKGRVVSSVLRRKKTFNCRLGVKFISRAKRAQVKLRRFVTALEKRYAVRLPF